MGFFWSGPRASIEGIFKRSARYWINTYVANKLYNGPDGLRSWKTRERELARLRALPPEDPAGSAQCLISQCRARMRGDGERITQKEAESIATQFGEYATHEGNLRGWSHEEMRAFGRLWLNEALGTHIPVSDALVRSARGKPRFITRDRPSGAPGLTRASQETAWERNHPAAIGRSGGIRGGAARTWAAHRYT